VEPRISGDTVEGIPGARVELPHYVIHSTIPDPAALQRIGQVLEGAHEAYRSLAPEVRLSSYPMECYLFETRPQWAAYTKAHTGDDAAIYLRVNRGGYTINDKFVAYWIGEIGTYSVAAHEGFHQYVARHLKGRLPPFLEEGLACMFEQLEWVEQGKNAEPLPRFDVRKNHARLMALRIAADGNDMYPLEALVKMHAGQVVGKRSAKIEAFYAESWGVCTVPPREASGGPAANAGRRFEGHALCRHVIGRCLRRTDLGPENGPADDRALSRDEADGRRG
jgi:hypothetical protein